MKNAILFQFFPTVLPVNFIFFTYKNELMNVSENFTLLSGDFFHNIYRTGFKLMLPYGQGLNREQLRKHDLLQENLRMAPN